MVLDIARIEAIHNKTGLLLLLHGGFGVPDEQVKMAVKVGVCKMNFATDLVYTFFNSVYAKNGEIKAMDVFMKEPVEAIKQYAIGKIRLLGADRIQKAHDWKHEGGLIKHQSLRCKTKQHTRRASQGQYCTAKQRRNQESTGRNGAAER